MSERRADAAQLKSPERGDVPKFEMVERDRARTLVASIPALHGDMSKPIVIAGFRSPWLLREVWEATRVSASGYSPRIAVVEMGELAVASCESSIEDIECDARVSRHTGEAWRATFLDLLTRYPEFLSDDASVLCEQGCENVRESVGSVQREATLAFQRELARERARCAAMYASRTGAWLTRRMEKHRAGSAEPLRVLLMTSRFTTYVRHAAEDLRGAFAHAGWTTDVLMEDDDHSMLTPLAYTRRIATFKPDVLVSINYPRGSLKVDLPRNLPVVCWVQDAMPHLFDEKIGAAQGPLDVLAGHTFAELFERYKYPRGRVVSMSMVADRRKFHVDPARKSARTDNSREIALVSHHSETPEAMHTRLLSESPESLRPLLDALLPQLKRAAVEAMSLAPAANVANIVAVTARQTLGGQPDPRLLTMIQRTYAMPLVDRMLRHETVEWAAAIASRRGWRLSLYGRGWDLHPRLGQFARGEVAHGEMLREVYVGAAAHLHVSATALVHQRVLECFLSGGLCLTRMHRDGLSGPRTTMNQALLARGPDAENVERGLGYRVVDDPEAMAFVSLVQRLGLGDATGVWDGMVWIPRAKAESLRRMGDLIAQDHDANWLLGDLATLSFGTPAQLEERLQWAVEGGDERERWIDAVRRRIENHLTHDAMVARLVGALTSDAKTESRAAA